MNEFDKIWNETMGCGACDVKPCEDVVSRQAVIDIIDFEDKWLFDANGHNANTHIAFSGLESRVKALPPVTPQRPKGKWIMNSDYPDRLICDKCNAQFDVWHWESKQMHYCPNCGAEMSGGADD